jgi:hypothetical protein
MGKIFKKEITNDKPELIIKQKRLFLLTDGEVSNPDKVIELASKSAENVKIHSFGVGSDCSK